MNRYQQIVLYCLQNSLTEEVRSNLMSITKSEWYEVISAADILYLTPLIATCIERHGIDIPPQIYDSLKTSLKNNTALNLRLLAEFQKIAKALQSKNISFISLKGVYLATSLYKNVGERLIGDISPKRCS